MSSSKFLINRHVAKKKIKSQIKTLGSKTKNKNKMLFSGKHEIKNYLFV